MGGISDVREVGRTGNPLMCFFPVKPPHSNAGSFSQRRKGPEKAAKKRLAGKAKLYQ